MDRGRRTRIAVIDRSEFSRRERRLNCIRPAPALSAGSEDTHRSHRSIRVFAGAKGVSTAYRGPGSLCEANSKTVADGTRTRRTGPLPVIPNHFSASGLRVIPQRLAGERRALRCCDACPCRPGGRRALRCCDACPCRPAARGGAASVAMHVLAARGGGERCDACPCRHVLAARPCRP